MRRWTRVAAIAAASLVVPAGLIGLSTSPASAAANAGKGFPRQFAAPYVQTDQINLMASDRSATGLKYYTLAFIIPRGSCTPQWEADTGASLGAYTSAVNSLRAAGGDVIVSFGGASGGELAKSCTSLSSLESAYRSVIDTYNLTRVDFDVEGSVINDSGANSRRNQALADVQKYYADRGKTLAVDYTLAVSPSGFESPQLSLLKDAKSKGLNVNLTNLMVMDFGDGENALRDGESAANGAHSQLGSIWNTKSSAQLWAMEGLTPIAGRNDDNENFSTSDAQSLESFAKSRGVTELAFWEVAIDKGKGYAYSKIFNQITGGSTPNPSPNPSPQPSSPPPSGSFELISATDGRCLDDPGSNTTSGTQFDVWTCHHGSNQEFTYNSSTKALQFLGKCLDVYAGASTDGTKVEVWSCNGHSSQAWTFNSNGTITTPTGKCLDVTGGGSSANGSLVEIWTCASGASNQKWSKG
jgi:chitinase